MVLLKLGARRRVMDVVYGAWPWMQKVEPWILEWEGFES